MTWWVVRASQTSPPQTGAVLPGLHAQQRVVPPSYRADPLAIRAEPGIHTCSSLNVLPTRAFFQVQRRERLVVKVHPEAYSTYVLDYNISAGGRRGYPHG